MNYILDSAAPTIIEGGIDISMVLIAVLISIFIAVSILVTIKLVNKEKR